MLGATVLNDGNHSGGLSGEGKGRDRLAEAEAKADAGRGRMAASRRWQRGGRQVGRPTRRRDGEGDAGKVMIELSKSQIDQVVRGVGEGGTISILLSALRDPDWKLTISDEDRNRTYPELDDRRLSRSLLAGLMVLSCFPVDGRYMGIAELARMLEMNTSTTHRYVTTLLVVGLIERDPATRRYRIAAG